MYTPLINNGNTTVGMFYYETHGTYMHAIKLTVKHSYWLFFCIPFTCSCGGCLLGCNWWSNWSDSGHCGVLPPADVVSMHSISVYPYQMW